MPQSLSVSVTAPVPLRGTTLNTDWGDLRIPTNGVLNVNTRLLPMLQKLGFTQSVVPDTSNPAGLGTTVQLTAPAGVSEVQGIGSSVIKVVAGKVTVPRDHVASLINEGFTL